VILAALAISTSGCVRIDSGGAGVLWSALSGGTQEEVYQEGLHLVAPWNRMFIYDIRVHERLEKIQVLSSNGLQVGLEVTVRFAPDAAALPRLQQTIGPAYYEKIVQPALRSEVRKVMGQYTPEEVYSSKRDQVADEIFASVLGAMAEKQVILDAIFLRNVQLPEKLRTAIEEKLQEEQRSEKMKFTLQRERQEADRKRIEAQGIADFQKIVSQGISAELLKWKGIEATQELANSPNAKVVVIGSGDSGLPLILGGP
jgi:regulator of protease activity HflC (stomatin/prohibitin superfamily)